MKLLDKKEINTTVQLERKSIIDSGIVLAKKVDALREEVLNLEKQRADFIASSKQIIQTELLDLRSEKGELEAEIEDGVKRLIKLRQPLDDEWREVTNQKIALDGLIAQNDEYLSSLIAERKELEAEKAEINTLLASALENDHETTRLLEKAQQNKDETEEYLNKVRGVEESKEIELYTRENTLATREKLLTVRETTLKKDQLELNKEKKLLAIKKQRMQ